ncbi:MAG TPA: YceI family protein [Rhodanobacteraceae bacterium]|nr:YceI family protein [Rhodanobacteraceae bacterium]
MKFYRVLAVPALLAASSVAFAAPSDYRFYMAHTQIFFSVSHLNYSHPMGRMHVKGGYFSFDPDDWSSAKVDVTIDIASLDMGDEAWSNKMRSAFFDVTTYPTAHYVSTKVEKTGERTGVVHGNLTLLGKTHPVDLQVTFNRAAADGYSMRYIAGFAATAAFKRSTFGMTRSLPDNGDDVAIHIEVEGIRDGDAQKQAPADAAEHP